MGRRTSPVAALCLVLAFAAAAVPGLATDYTVGDSAGWAIGTDYDTWASGKTFKVGDNLVFKYTGGHTVDEVKSADYSSCTTGNSISTDSSGSTTIPLKTAGDHYFICAITGHCSSGMKLSVKVVAASAGTPPTATAGTPPTSSTTPGSSTTPTDASSAASLAIPALGVVVVSWVSRVVLSFV
uniref:Phytocyanin domain-containing protein n=1 Tax=Kalanchoe fedtschenkoi TaxID=63787 RepID=A0A7N1A352_KALFE